MSKDETMLCAPCLISGVDTDAVTQVEGTTMCRDHGGAFVSMGRIRAMVVRSERQAEHAEIAAQTASALKKSDK